MSGPFARLVAVPACLSVAVFAQESPTHDRSHASPSHLRQHPESRPQQPTPTPRLLDISLDGLFALGTSTERDDALGDLQAGGHDPRKRGFTLQAIELSLTAEVDPHLDAAAHIVAFLDPITGESEFELEEAFATTRELPANLQIKAGLYLTEFGRHNPTHAHAWDWLDAPVIHTRIFGADGMRAPGARVSWLAPTSWKSDLCFGLQNANGETMSSFLASEELFAERPVGGRFFTARDVRSFEDLVWSARCANSFGIGDETTFAAGASIAYGPNATGADADTLVYGADFLLRWRPTPHSEDSPSWSLGAEFVARDYSAAAQVDENDPLVNGDEVFLPQADLRDWGCTTHVLYGFSHDWAAGLRWDFATGSGASYDASIHAFASRQDDPFRNDRQRFSPLVAWRPSEFARIRLQYNYDVADTLHAGEAHSVWLGFEFLIGAHAGHAH